jgi:heme oxygenase
LPTHFRTLLAAATRDLHVAIEHEIGLDDNPPLGRYLAYLGAMHAIVGGVEERLEEAFAVLALEPEVRRKRRWLEEDLRHFRIAALGPAPALEVPREIPAAIGWAYVLEGSMLGGRVLYKRLASRWALGPGQGATFLCGYGPETATRWRRFVDALESIELTAEQMDACIAGARQAFDAIRAAFRDSIARADLGADGNARLAAGTPAGQRTHTPVEPAQAEQREERLSQG